MYRQVSGQCSVTDTPTGIADIGCTTHCDLIYILVQGDKHPITGYSHNLDT